MKRLGVAVLLAGLTACSTVPASPAQSVYALKGEYAAALSVAAAYHDLPPCPGPVLCKDGTTMVRIQAAVLAANRSLDAAELAVRRGGDVASAVDLAQQSVLALEAITTALKVK